MKITFDKSAKAVLILSLLLVALSVFYYYVIFLPQKEQARIEQQKQEQLAEELKEQEAKEEAEQEKRLNRLLLDTCLNEADNSLKNSFISLCKDDGRISGGDEASCLAGTIDDNVSYMTASNLYSSLFKRILDKREKDKDECFKKYPQK